jgi:hypothetical protein
MGKDFKEAGILPASAVKGIATGLFMMAFFTLMWAGIAFGGLYPSNYWFALLVFPVFIVLFVINGIHLFKIAKFFPKLTTEADKAEGKRMGMWFGIIFGAEGLLIFVGINIVVNLGYPDLTIPTIALVVGLHFFPLGKVFKRTIDYYLASWSTIVALFGFLFTLNHTMPVNYIQTFVGIGLAMATSCYGFYMIVSGRALEKGMPQQ